MNNITFLSKIGSICLFFLLSIGSGWAQCDLPTAITVTSVNQVSATLTWTLSDSPTLEDYQTELRTSGAPGSGATGLVLVSAPAAQNGSITYNQLIPLQTYYFYIKSRCSDSLQSAWSAPVQFTTLGLITPLAIDASDVTNVSFVARWQASLGATEYEVQYTTAANEDWAGAQTFTTAGALNKLIVNLAPLTDYKYRVRARVGEGPYTGWSNVITVPTIDDPVTIARYTLEGWLAQPTEEVEVYIEANYNSGADDYGSALFANTLTVFPNVTFTLAAGTFAMITENIINNGGSAANFVVESNANLFQIGTTPNVGEITVHRESYPIYRLDYTMWSSPVLQQNLLAFSPATNTTRFYSYNSADNNFNTIDNPGSKVFVPGEGYLIRAPNTWVPYMQGVPGQKWLGEFKGEPNAADVTVDLEPGYNMVGNPYPTDIGVVALINENPSIGKDVYFWRRRNNANTTDPHTAYYSAFGLNGIVGVIVPGEAEVQSTRSNGIIKVGQGFIVKRSDASTTLTFSNLVKRNDNFQNIFLKNGSNSDDDGVERHKFYLHLNSGSGFGSEILLAYTAGQEASDGIDVGDTPTLGNPNVGLSYLIEDQSFVIQGKPLPFEQTDEIALRLQTIVAATYTISLNDVTGMFTEAVDPILIDMLTNTETNLRNGSYTFATEAGTFDARFKIVFVENYLSNNDVAANANAVFVISKDNVLSVNAGTYTINNIDIFDIQGRKIYSKENVDASSTSISDLRAKNQIILVQIATDHGVVTKKVQF